MERELSVSTSHRWAGNHSVKEVPGGFLLTRKGISATFSGGTKSNPSETRGSGERGKSTVFPIGLT